MSSHEIALADANLAEIARLHDKITGLHEALAQKDQAILAERRARDMALADTAALGHVLRLAQPDVCSLNCPSTWRTADGPPPHSDKCQAISAALTAAHPGAQLLAELDALRYELRHGEPPF